MKSLKYEGVVKLKIFWSLKRLEAGLNGFRIKRVHYGKFGLQIIREPSNFSKTKHAPPLLYINRRLPPLSRLLLLRLQSSSSFLLSPATTGGHDGGPGLDRPPCSLPRVLHSSSSCCFFARHRLPPCFPAKLLFFRRVFTADGGWEVSLWFLLAFSSHSFPFQHHFRHPSLPFTPSSASPLREWFPGITAAAGGGDTIFSHSWTP